MGEIICKTYKRINKKAVISWIIGRAIFTVIFLPVFFTGMYFIVFKNWGDDAVIMTIAITISILVTLLVLLNNFLYPYIEYKEWRYAVLEDKIELIHGIFMRRKTIIPISRVQNINIVQGPIYRKFGLASVKIITAGSSHNIPALTNEEAETITENLKRVIEIGGRIEY